jgi:type IV pilus assembly protein PilM
LAAIEDHSDALVINQNSACITTAITKQNEVLLHRTLELPEHAGNDIPDIQQAVSVAIAYFEDSLNVPLESLFYVGPGGAAAFDTILNQPDSGASHVRIRDLVEPPGTGIVSPVPIGILAGVTGALAN